MKFGIFSAALAAVFVILGCAAAGNHDEEYEIGGPLAGLKLPLFPTQHGEPPGYPGCFIDEEGNFINSPQGQAPQLKLYPGSVENWRAYWFHYMPIRSMYDRQSQIRNWVANPAGDPERGYLPLPGVDDEDLGEYAQPLYWLGSHGAAQHTGNFLEPAPVVRWSVDGPIFDLDLGELEPGLYVVRVIGAVETEKLRSFLRPVWLLMKINEGIDGDIHEYRVRIPYNDEFYSVAEIYFHAPERRSYRAELSMDPESEVDLLVHNITLDDALAGTARKPVKKFSVARRPEPADFNMEQYWGRRETLTPEERLARDEAIWNAFPPLNKPGIYDWWIGDGGMRFGAEGKLIAQINEEHGEWRRAGIAGGGRRSFFFADDHEGFNVLLRNEKLGLVYTIEDLAANRPLPDPFPYKDDGQGLYWLSPDIPDKSEGRLVFAPIALAYIGRVSEYIRLMHTGGGLVIEGDPNQDNARDAAIALIRFAYSYPAMDAHNEIQFMTQDPFSRGRNILRRRHTIGGGASYWYRHFVPLKAYDRLFDYINGNEELALSVNRFVPWVETSEDVRSLLDSFLMETMAKRYMRYHYFGDGRQPEQLGLVATYAGNPDYTRDWMDWWFSRVFFYPTAVTGIPDQAISGTCRDGRSPIGSFGYMIGEFSADEAAKNVERYIDTGGDIKYDLRDFSRYPKSISALEFDLRLRTAGIHFPRFGSGSGADKMPAAGWKPERAIHGWLWTRDPKFAYVIKHHIGRQQDGDPLGAIRSRIQDELDRVHAQITDAEWEEIEEAADKLTRAPWFENRSRIMPNVGAFLESGLNHDDFRFRRSVWVRTGIGRGHHHADTLDLQLHAHGLPMIADSGQRRDSEYSKPHDTQSRVHNTVVIGGHNWMGYSWTRVLNDAEGASYLLAEAVPQAGTRLFRRQVALIDVDEGQGGQPLSPEQFGPTPVEMPANVVTPHSYVFDVFRVSGADRHTYSFRATVNDPNSKQPELNLPGLNRLPAVGEAFADGELAGRAASWLEEFSGERYYAPAPAQFDVTFPFLKERGRTERWAGYGSERVYMGRAFDPDSPDKFLRLHMFGAEDGLFMKGDQHTHARDYWMPYVYLQRDGRELESVFVAIIEPFAGEPFILDKRELEVAENEDDSLRAAAVELTLRDGRQDVCFADGRPDNVREIGDMRISGEFAYLSTDEEGVRQATLTGGTLLDTPHIIIRTAAPRYVGAVVEVDYLNKSILLDNSWPEWSSGDRLVEIGRPPEEEGNGYVTSYMAVSSERDGEGSRLTLLRGADYYRSRIKSVDAEENIVVCAMPAPFGAPAGMNRGFAATNDNMTKSWRADILPGDQTEKSYPFRLHGEEATVDDFAPQNALRLWEYGVGDTVRMNSSVNVRRVETGVYEIKSDVDVEITLDGETHNMRAERFAEDGGSIILRARQ